MESMKHYGPIFKAKNGKLYTVGDAGECGGKPMFGIIQTDPKVRGGAWIRWGYREFRPDRFVEMLAKKAARLGWTVVEDAPSLPAWDEIGRSAEIGFNLRVEDEYVPTIWFHQSVIVQKVADEWVVSGPHGEGRGSSQAHALVKYIRLTLTAE